MARKFGPTRGEYLFRLASGLVILALIGVLLVQNGMPGSLLPSESILFGGLFALFLVGQAVWKIYKKDYRLPK